MTPEAAIVRGLRDALAHDLPSDMRQGIQRAIELYTGKPEPRPAPPETGPPRDALYNQPIEFNIKTTIGGKPLFDNINHSNPFDRR